MKRYFAVVLFILLVSCGGDPAKEIYDTADFEEIQNNHRHALSLYEELVQKYPDSEYAEASRKRISALKEMEIGSKK